MDSSLQQTPPSMGFSRQEYWSGLPFPSPGNLPNPEIEPRSPALYKDDLPSIFPIITFPSSLSAIRVVSSVYLRLLMFLQAVLIPSCASSSLTFHMICSAYKFNKQGDNIQFWCTPLSIWNQSVVPCPVLTVASWPAYRCVRRQVR